MNMAQQVINTWDHSRWNGCDSWTSFINAHTSIARKRGVKIWSANDGLDCRQWSVQPNEKYKFPDGSILMIGCGEPIEVAA